MCGIAGEIRYRGKPGLADWKKISALMKRRGPDDYGEWQDAYCDLVFRRLSIIDLSQAGHQPMVSEDGRYILTYNGELYNFKDIRQRLVQEGIRFRSKSDTEVVLYSLIKWGAKALEGFNGIFALGLYDRQEKKLLLARDHAGIKPLYYMQNPAGLMFASQYDQILAHPWSRDLDYSPSAATMYLHLASIPAPYGILENTFMLKPGNWLEVDGEGKITKGVYYEFPDTEKPTIFGKEAFEAVDAAITSAVKRQLVSDVPVGAFLSGGIDSPLICAKMQEVSSSKMRAFTIGTQGDKTDESQDAIRYAKALGLDHVVKQVSPDDAIELLQDVVTACGEPFGDFSMFPTLQVCKLATQEFTVMLSGDGGDELFWGYSNRFKTLMKRSSDFRQSYSHRRVLRGARRIMRLPEKPSHNHKTLGDWQLAQQSRIPNGTLKQIFPELPSWPKDYTVYDYAGYEPDETARWIRNNEFVGHLSGVLQKVDRSSMFNSLEVRVPLLDREVIDIASRVDWKDCFDMATGNGKIPLRRSLAKYLSFQTSAKKGFSPPMGKWLQTSLRPVVEDVLLTRDNLLGIPLNKKALRDYYHYHLDGKANGWGFWSLLSLAFWEQHHGR